MSETNNSNKFNNSYAGQVNDIIDTLELETETDRSILKSRFLGEVINYEKTHMVDQEITDYDDDGNEIIGTSKVMVKEPAQKVNRVLKTKVYDKDFIKENLIEFTYLKVKNIYKEKFGSENIKDL